MKRLINLLILQILTFVSFSQTRTTSGDAIRKEITPKYVNGVIKQLTISQLKAQVITNGDSTTLYYVTDAGKKGYFELDKNDNSSTGNDSTIIVTNNGKRLKRSIDQYLQKNINTKVSYSDFIGLYTRPEWHRDSLDADDTKSLQRAFDYAENSKITILLSAKYNTSYTVFYGSDITILGNNTVIEINNPNIGSVFASKSFYASYYNQNGSTKNVKIKNIKFEVPDSAEVAGIGINRGENIIVDGCVSVNMKSHLVDITGKNITIKNCKAYNSIQPNAPYQVDNLEVGNGNPQWITDSTGASVSIVNDGFQSENILIENNESYNCYHSVHIHRNNLGKKSYVTIRNNRFFNSEIPFYCDPGKTWDGVTIEGNIFHSDTVRLQAILAEGTLYNLNIKNNIFYNYVNIFRQSSAGASWAGGSFESNTCFASPSSLPISDRRAINIQRNVSGVVFSNNTFEGFDRGINSNSTATVSSIRIQNNNFVNIKERAVGLDKATDFIVSYNKVQSLNKSYNLDNFTSTSWRTYASDFGIAGIVINDSNNGIIEGNTFNDLNCVAIALNSISANNITIKNNFARNCIGLITTIYSSTQKSIGLKITGNTLDANSWLYTYGVAYIISTQNLIANNNIANGVFYNGFDIRETSNISIFGNLVNGGFSSGTDKKAYTFTNCTGIKYKDNTSSAYNTIPNNSELYINGCVDSEFFCTKSLGWINASSTSNCRFFYNSNNLPTGSQVGRFGVGSIITNDNNTGGVPTGEPQGWVCIAESNTSTFVPFGQLGNRTTNGNPNSNNITSFFVGEELFDTSLNRFWKSISISAPTSGAPTWMLITQDNINAQFSIDPPSISAGGFYSQDFTVSGVLQGMYVDASITGNTGNLIFSAKYISDNTVRLVIFNPNSSSIDYGSSQLLIRARK